jgi:undecaprenyl diphosphate synthase
MDGNGRWAAKKKLPRVIGHSEGVKAVRRITQFCGELGVKMLTLYTFSTENWGRPKSEVSALMKLFIQSLKKEIKDLMKNNVRLTMIGDIDSLPDDVVKKLKDSIDKTSGNTGLNLNLAFNYGSRQEIVRAVQLVSSEVQNSNISIDEIDESTISKYLFTNDVIDPDLLIRTGGEYRISNFMLWQIAYTELYFTQTYWPDFSSDNLIQAIQDFQSRERRFGETSEQVKE